MKTIYWRKPRPGTIGEDLPADDRTSVPDDSEEPKEADHAEDDR